LLTLRVYIEKLSIDLGGSPVLAHPTDERPHIKQKRMFVRQTGCCL